MHYSRYFAWLFTLVLADALCLTVHLCSHFSGMLFLVGLSDVIQGHHSILRNLPIDWAPAFYVATYAQQIRQYFLEDDEEKNPFSPRNQRAMVYKLLYSQPRGSRRSTKLMYGQDGGVA
jgi:hypothetical protein